MNTIDALILNIIGGVIAAFVFMLIIKLRKYFRQRRFKYILGDDADIENEIYLVYAKLELPQLYDQKNKIIRYPYIKPNSKLGSQPASFSIEFPVSSCEVRALKYLTSSLISQFYGKSKLVSDIDDEVENKLNLSFISMGGPLSNYKTRDLLENEANKLIKIGSDNFYSKKNEKLVQNFEIGFDYGLIMRIRPAQFKKRVWIICAGIGEWGTSGSAWFLSNKYEEIFKHLKGKFNFFAFGKSKDFAALVKVKREQDESAKLLAIFTSEQDIDEYISKLPRNDLQTEKKLGQYLSADHQIKSASAADTYDSSSGTNLDIGKDKK